MRCDERDPGDRARRSSIDQQRELEKSSLVISRVSPDLSLSSVNLLFLNLLVGSISRFLERSTDLKLPSILEKLPSYNQS